MNRRAAKEVTHSNPCSPPLKLLLVQVLHLQAEGKTPSDLQTLTVISGYNLL